MPTQLPLWSIAIVAVLTTSCIGTIEGELPGCTRTCVTYSDCFAVRYDADACSDRCKDNEKVDVSFADKAASCDECVAALSCSVDAFTCADECHGVVP